MLPRIQSASIRLAELEDVPAILAIERASPSAAHWTNEQYKSRVQSAIQDACFLVAECEGRTCGFICARVVAGEWEIENVVVADSFRCLGIGAQLMEALTAKWEESGATGLLLEVRESNAAARALYAKHGIQEIGRRRAYYSDPEEDAILYARR